MSGCVFSLVRAVAACARGVLGCVCTRVQQTPVWFLLLFALSNPVSGESLPHVHSRVASPSWLTVVSNKRRKVMVSQPLVSLCRCCSLAQHRFVFLQRHLQQSPPAPGLSVRDRAVCA